MTLPNNINDFTNINLSEIVKTSIENMLDGFSFSKYPRLSDFGVDSINAVLLTIEINGMFGTQLDASDILRANDLKAITALISDDPRPNSFARRVRDTAGTFDQIFESPLSIRQRDEGSIVLCFPPALGLSWSYTSLQSELSDNLSIFGLQAPGYALGSKPHNNIREVVCYFVNQAMEIVKNNNFHIIGWSYGSGIAFEVIKYFECVGIKPESVTFIASEPFSFCGNIRTNEDLFRSFCDILRNAPDAIGLVDSESDSNLVGQHDHDKGKEPSRISFLRRAFEIYKSHLNIGNFDQVGVVNGKLNLIFPSQTKNKNVNISKYLWEQHFKGGVTIHRVPAGIFDIDRPSVMRSIGSIINKYIS